MKNLFFLLIVLFFVNKISIAQPTHPTIKSFAIIFEDGNLNQVSSIVDSTVIIKYVLEIADTNSVKKIHVRISSGQNTNGNIYSSSFPMNPISQINNMGKIIFLRDKNKIHITTVNVTQLSDVNLEVATEDYQGQLSTYLNWEK